MKLQVILSIFLMRGQYLHLPSLVQTGVCGFFSIIGNGGYWIVALVRYSLKLGSLLKPIRGVFFIFLYIKK